MKTRIIVTVETELPLSDEQKLEMLRNMKNRLEGLYTTCPEFLKEAKSVISLEEI